MDLPGVYAFRFGGFERRDRNARYLVGLGRLTVNADGSVTGEHRATNSPMWGQVAEGRLRLRYSIWDLTGTCQVIDAGPPLVAEAKIRFERRRDNKADPVEAMRDTFIFQQAGIDRFWLISSDPRDDAGSDRIDELVTGEAIKIDRGTW